VPCMPRVSCMLQDAFKSVSACLKALCIDECALTVLAKKDRKHMSEYILLLVYLVLSIVPSMTILGLSFVFSTHKPDPKKVAAYECGFDPFDDARARFDIRFHLTDGGRKKKEILWGETAHREA
jgi:cytochrome bd-type quinol oxidase subunit 1